MCCPTCKTSCASLLLQYGQLFSEVLPQTTQACPGHSQAMASQRIDDHAGKYSGEAHALTPRCATATANEHLVVQHVVQGFFETVPVHDGAALHEPRHIIGQVLSPVAVGCFAARSPDR